MRKGVRHERARRFGFALLGLVTAAACSPGGGTIMTAVPASAFPDPAQRRAAQLVADRQGVAAVAAAQVAPGGVNLIGAEGDTLLLIAVTGNDPATVRALLQAGANPQIPEQMAPIAVAAERASIEVVQLLLQAHAKANGAVGSETALWRAALGGREDVAQLLLQAGAAVDQANVDGDTPAIAATQSDHFRMALFLLRHGASPFAASRRGFTMGFWAARARLGPDSDEARARDALVYGLQEVGFPWPPPGGKAVLAMQAEGAWPPRRH